MQEIENRACELLAQCAVATIATIDENGTPRPVPMSIIDNEGIRTIWFATRASSAKTAHIRANSRTGVSLFCQRDNLVLTGTAEVITDPQAKLSHWQEWFIKYFSLGPDDPEYVLIKFSAEAASIYIADNCS